MNFYRNIYIYKILPAAALATATADARSASENCRPTASFWSFFTLDVNDNFLRLLSESIAGGEFGTRHLSIDEGVSRT